ncbi:hypothetical protein AWW66_12030 [Micromonospora rosaria]|uniref:Uncharacterized protein n=1 Tax=Micromonospora rosaria TaxID=47874 RepID=A0A136PTN0_9ACTN|nr:hypothetical protein [Micromonospora rosaria]KXK61727.1 hypothetical protein AWW66_12030 [Micromonospora rosaria]
MGVDRTLWVILALFAAACLPVLIALVCCADEILDRLVCAVSEWRERRRERRTIARLDRAVGADALTRDIDLRELDRADRLPLEQIAAELRNLGTHRTTAVGRAAVWKGGTVEAYDSRLRAACRALGIDEHLTELTGVDLEIERVRVEGLLHRAGIALPAARAEQGERHR